jgi:acyl-CoA reductase-like NAD-dependent aldehyde dehydrogenase
LPTDPKLAKGLFVRPVLLVDVPHDSPICTNEIFGPVAAIMRWKDFDEVLHRANDTNFGLSASVWTNDLKMALQAVKQLEAGIVQVNQNYVVQPNLPFGGWKESGLGREGALEDMLEHFTKKKTISINMK